MIGCNRLEKTYLHRQDDELPDVLEIMMGFLAGLLSTLSAKTVVIICRNKPLELSC